MHHPPAPKKEHHRELQPQDLRGILKYVPMWRGHTFILSLDGAVLDDDTFGSLMMEVAVLHNLGIRVVLAFGIGEPLRSQALSRSRPISDSTGEEPVDQGTLDLSVEVAGAAQYALLRSLSQNRIRCAISNAVRATERGILMGQDHGHAGKVDRVDVSLLESLLDQSIVPVLPPIAFGRDGRPLRLNSDHLAAAVAESLRASKLIYVVSYPGLTLRGEFQLNIAVDELEDRLREDPDALDPQVRSKARAAIETIRAGVPRAHIIDSRLPDALLTEIFSNVGVGSMIHANPYTQIRPARRSDVGSIHRLTKAGTKDAALRRRSRGEIERNVSEYAVYEIDGSVIGCCRLAPLPEGDGLELMSLFVLPAYGRRGIGRALVAYGQDRARVEGHRALYALTTQTGPFFTQICGFEELARAEAPASLRDKAISEGRNSRILMQRTRPSA